jgi:hypothetical protein
MWRQFAIASVPTILPLFAAPQTIRGIDFKNALYEWHGLDRKVPSKWQWLTEAYG